MHTSSVYKCFFLPTYLSVYKCFFLPTYLSVFKCAYCLPLGEALHDTTYHRYLSNIDSVLLWNLVTTFVKKSAPKFSAWPQLFKFLYQFTFWIVLIFLIFFLFLSPNLIFAFWNATWWHFKIFHKNLNLRFLFNNLSHWWKSKQFAPKF